MSDDESESIDWQEVEPAGEDAGDGSGGVDPAALRNGEASHEDLAKLGAVIESSEGRPIDTDTTDSVDSLYSGDSSRPAAKPVGIGRRLVAYGGRLLDLLQFGLVILATFAANYVAVAVSWMTLLFGISYLDDFGADVDPVFSDPARIPPEFLDGYTPLVVAGIAMVLFAGQALFALYRYSSPRGPGRVSAEDIDRLAARVGVDVPTVDVSGCVEVGGRPGNPTVLVGAAVAAELTDAELDALVVNRLLTIRGFERRTRTLVLHQLMTYPLLMYLPLRLFALAVFGVALFVFFWAASLVGLAEAPATSHLALFAVFGGTCLGTVLVSYALLFVQKVLVELYFRLRAYVIDFRTARIVGDREALASAFRKLATVSGSSALGLVPWNESADVDDQDRWLVALDRNKQGETPSQMVARLVDVTPSLEARIRRLGE